MLRIVFAYCFILAMVFASLSAECAFKSSKRPDAAAPDSNPNRLPDDIEIPMPCGETMTMRGVSISQGALMWDKTFAMGLINVPEDLRNIYEKSRSGHIAGSFTGPDLPAEWRKRLAGEGVGETDTWYFIGKYELTNRQWKSVMDALDKEGTENPAACPAPNVKNANLPVTGASWFDAQEFLNKYNAWIVKNHPESLPSFGDSKNVAFFRLPTEEEWEYAARGGVKVPEDWWESNDIFPFEEGKRLRDYGFFLDGTTRGEPAPVGRRSANPLGLYDTVGNVREMVDGFFRMTIPDLNNGVVERRLHGSAGGFLSKGGGFRSDESEVMPGARQEHPLYTAAGAYGASDLGLRLVLAGLNIPDGGRRDLLLKEQKTIPAARAEANRKSLDISGEDPVSALETLAANTDADLKRNLLNIKDRLSEAETARAADNLRRLEHSLRSLLYQAETLRAFAYRYERVLNDVKKAKQLRGKTDNPQLKKEAEKMAANGERDLADYLKTLEMSANYYKSSLQAIYRQSEADATQILRELKKGYAGESIFDEHMSQNIAILESFLKKARTSGLSSITQNSILKGILPPLHYQAVRPGD